MFKRVATILNRLVACLFTVQSSETKGKHSNTASNLLVQSGQRCRDALALANQKPKRKRSAAQADTQAESTKQTPNPVLAVLGQGGLQRQILAQPSVKQSPKPKRSAAHKGTQVQSPKKTQKPALTMSGQDGLQPSTVVEKSRQDLSNKLSVVQSTKAEPSSSKGRTTTKRKATPAGKTSATPASKTRQVAKPAKTQKPKAAASTTQAKKRTPSKTPAQTRTARPSKAAGA